MVSTPPTTTTTAIADGNTNCRAVNNSTPPDFDFSTTCRYFKSSFARTLSLNGGNNNCRSLDFVGSGHDMQQQLPINNAVITKNEYIPTTNMMKNEVNSTNNTNTNTNNNNNNNKNIDNVVRSIPTKPITNTKVIKPALRCPILVSKTINNNNNNNQQQQQQQQLNMPEENVKKQQFLPQVAAAHIWPSTLNKVNSNNNNNINQNPNNSNNRKNIWSRDNMKQVSILKKSTQNYRKQKSKKKDEAT